MCKRCDELRDVVTPAVAQAIADVDDSAAHLLGQLLLAGANVREWNAEQMAERVDSIVLDSHQNSRRSTLRLVAWLIVRLALIRNRLIAEAEQQDDDLGIVIEVDDENNGLRVRVRDEPERFVPIPEGETAAHVAYTIAQEYRELFNEGHNFP